MPKVFRDTKQRVAIIETLREYGHPMTARHIRDRASDMVPSLGIATVYRNIRYLLDSGEIEQIDVPGATSYYGIPREGNHVLAVCKDSQRVQLIPEVDVSAGVLKKLPKNFKADSFQMFVLGTFTDSPTAL